jgi:anti-sigma factor RsiW
MKREELEFRISQYAGGTLPADDVAALDEILARDSEARSLLAEYRGLDAMLKRELPLPKVEWDALSASISSAVAREQIPAKTIKLWTLQTWSRVAVAAMVLMVVALAAMLPSRGSNTGDVATTTPTPTPPVRPIQTTPAVVHVASVTGPAVERGRGAPVAVVSIGPSALAQQRNNRWAETIVYRPPRVVIASGQASRQDSQRLPY